jgi:CheY-like chemotaxis protein
MEVRMHNRKLLIKVSNHGHGISQEVQEHLFNPFVTGGCRHRKGTGLGLYIVKMKIMSMGGHICVSSEPDGLTSFTVTLPLLEGEMREEISSEKQYSNNPHVLLAGPLRFPQGLQKLPETMGCRVSRVANGNELLNMVSQDVPDVIILDSELHAIEAEEVLHRLKKNAVLRAIPVLVTKGHNREDTTDETLLTAGADGIIGDGFNYRELYQVLTPFLHAE